MSSEADPQRLAATAGPRGHRPTAQGRRQLTMATDLTASPERIRGFLWATEFLVVTNFLQAEPHAHGALQLSVGLEGAPRAKLDGEWRQVAGLIVNTGAEHGFECAGALTAIGWVESESPAGRFLRGSLLRDRDWVSLDEATTEALRASLAGVFDADCDTAHRRWRSALEVLGARALTEDAHDPRIRAVLDHLRAVPTPPPTVEDLCRISHLSESRLQHVFREQVGVPIRRYLLWHRYMVAMRHLSAGASATDAAHAAGFADSAHFTRTARTVNGFTPTKMPFREWLTSCP
ncbi:helix-turn-helix domain-containing protein [Nocardioides sp. zg-579]|uniref:Helix-turn-helix domain-containing protein n=2 Tax=Nocardioides marmotae TaxID=2663857 RepID=A0A6I3JFT9_9ACTN|nr:helix-turn-helix domain-containing protein [Gordonia jinghuaiqii]MTB97001.1 helix-turn-helix domain-containing protein [Nocardioides marmotae]